jgi:hypothetical protein
MFSGLTAQIGIMRTLEKVIHSLQSSNCAKDLAKLPSNVSEVCVPDKEHSCSYPYKLCDHIETQAG